MTFNIQNTIFTELIKKYPTWQQLHTFLESNEGGNFRVVDKDEAGLVLIRYEKGISKMDLPHSRWFRSVVWDTHNNLPISVAPPKTTTDTFPFKSIKDIKENKIVCQELYDGFMINCFKIANSDIVYITSRSKLDATGKFYSSKTFRQLFLESYSNTYNCVEGNFDLIPKPDIAKQETSIFFSFLVQHKEHRIVKDIKENKVFLVQKGTIYNDGKIDIEDGIDIFDNKINMININLEFGVARGSYAKVLMSNEISEVETAIKNYLMNQQWDFQGLVFKDSLGNRWRFRSEKYIAVKSLRGNSPLMLERFTQLYSQNLVNKYLEYYPSETEIISKNLILVQSLILKLYNLYIDLHIVKSKKSDEIDKGFLPHLYSIHSIYLNQLRPQYKKITQNEIQLYLHKLPWQRLAFLIKKLQSV